MKFRPWDTLLINIGDTSSTVLCLPADENSLICNQKNHWIVEKGQGYLLEHAQPIRSFIEAPKNFKLIEFFKIFKKIKDHLPEKVIIFQAPFWIYLLVWMVGIKKRIGLLGPWYSFLFLNFGVRQNRAQAEFKEVIYNHMLVKSGLLQAGASRQLHKIHQENNPSFLKLWHPDVQSVLEKFNLSDAPYFIVYPGSEISAPYWPTGYFSKLIEHLCESATVLIYEKGCQSEKLQKFKEHLSGHSNLIWLNRDLDPTDFLALLQGAQAIVGPHSDAIHLAASVGTSTLGLYGDDFYNSSTRWGPNGPKVKSIVSKKEKVKKGDTPQAVYQALENIIEIM